MFPYLTPSDPQYSYKVVQAFIERVFEGVQVISFDSEKAQQYYSEYLETGEYRQTKALLKTVEIEFKAPCLTRLFILSLRKKLKSAARIRIFNILLRKNILNGIESLSSPQGSLNLLEQLLVIKVTKYLMECTFSSDNLGDTLKLSPGLGYLLSKVQFLSKFSFACAFLIKSLSKQIKSEMIPIVQVSETGIQFIHSIKSV